MAITAFPIAEQQIQTSGGVEGNGTSATPIKNSNNGTTNAHLSDMANGTIKGRSTAGTGDPEDLTAAQVKALLSIDDLVALSGVTDGSSDLGTFTGTTIGDNLTIKDALQAIETAIESASGSSSYVTTTVNGARITYRTLSGTPVITFDTTTATAPVLSVSGGTIRLKEVRHTVNPATSTNYTYTFNATWADALDSMPTTVTKYKVPSYQMDLDNTPAVLCPGGTTSQITVDFWAVSEQMVFVFSWSNCE